MELFTIYTPLAKPVPLIANLPHSGIFVPEEIATQFTPQHLQSLPNTDWHLDKLYNFLPTLGITVINATHSRYVVDLNREIKTPITGSFWSSIVTTQTAFGQPIYTINPSQEEVRKRIDKYYIPYHNQLQTLLQKKVKEFGKVYLLDLHSFFGPITDEICLGNFNRQSCSEFLISSIEQSLIRHGLQVVKNKTFTGGYITRHYSQMLNVEVLQIEVRYHVYLDTNQLDKPRPPDWNVSQFSKAKSKFKDIFVSIVNQLSVA